VPGTEHIIYAYYVDFVSGERTSEITRFSVNTASVNLGDIEFEWEIEVDENYAYVEISPKNYSGNYYFDVLYVQEVEDYINTYGGTIEGYIETWWNTLVTEDIQQGIMKTWQSIFDLKFRDRDWSPWAWWNRSIQATFWCFIFCVFTSLPPADSKGIVARAHSKNASCGDRC
jgi:hypothetical protein